MGLQERIRHLVDRVLDANINVEYSVKELSDQIFIGTGSYYSAQQIYDSIKELHYDDHSYVRTVSSFPYTYQRLR